MSNPPLPVGPPHANHLTYGQVDGVIQPQWEIDDDTRGLIEGTLSVYYSVSDPRSPSPTPRPARGDIHPWDSRLKCYKSTTRFSSNGLALMQASYIGLTRDPTLAETEVSGTTSSQNVALHPNFPTLAMERKPDAKGNGMKFYNYIDTVNNDKVNFERFNVSTTPAPEMRGVDSYLAPRATVRVTFYTSNFGTAEKMVSNLGTIADIPYLANGPLPTGCNFLLSGASITTYGTVYKISSEWMASEQGKKWTSWLYRDFGSGGREAEIKYTLKGTNNPFGSTKNYHF